MTTIRRPGAHRSLGVSRIQSKVVAVVVVVVILLLWWLLVGWLVPRPYPYDNIINSTKSINGDHSIYSSHNYNTTSIRSSLQSVIERQRQQLQRALQSLNTEGNLPARLRALRDRNEIVGERLAEVRAGTETVREILHGHDDVILSRQQQGENMVDQPPMELAEIIDFLDQWIHRLHGVLSQVKRATYDGIWQAYHDLVVDTLYPWDREYLRRMPRRRHDDGSIFLSIATYRDENCFGTVYHAYEKAANPDKLFIGLVQQNCHANCKSGVLANLSVVDVPPDDDCYELFCRTDLGGPICARNQIRILNIDEPESLGPYAARYFASKLWYGEQWYMQIDAHMTFATNWDQISIDMLQAAPSPKPVLSHYPPSHETDLDANKDKPASRLCGPVFATSDLEAQIIRLEGASRYDKDQLSFPAFAPFTAAGYFVAHSEFLREVPFDPFLPWIFMGEEIIMSSRLWTAGYDIFSPNINVVGHMYIRRHKPKFWESVHRAFTMGVHNPLKMMVLDRIKHQLGYPESSRDMLKFKSILTAVEQYSMGHARPLEQYLRMVGMNMTTKTMKRTRWCEGGFPPVGFEQYNDLYPAGRARMAQPKAVTE